MAWHSRPCTSSSASRSRDSSPRRPEGKGASYVAQLWGMRYPADRLVNAARRLPLPWCRQAVIRCAQTDLAMKSTGQDPKELMTTLLLELANMA